MREKGVLGRTFSKVMSWMLVIAIVFGMTPANFVLVTEAAAAATNITVHFQNEYIWETPAIQWWQYNDVTPSHGGNTVGEENIQTIPGWNGAKGVLLADDKDGFYSISLKGNIGGFQFLNMNNPSNNTGNVYDEAAMPQYNNSDTPKDLYAIWQGSTIKWYLDAGGTEELTAPQGAVTSTDLTVHFKNERAWDTVYGTFGAGGSWVAITGYEYCKNGTGGIIRENTKNSGWHTYRITKSDNLVVNGNFNCGAWSGANQTGNYSIPITDEIMEVWITFDNASQKNDITVSHTKPENWNMGFTAEAPVNPATLSKIKSPVINADGSVTFNYEISTSKLGENKLYLMGDGYFTDWNTGVEMTDGDGDGVYSVTIPDVKPGSYQYKFRYGSTWVSDPLNNKTASGNSLLVIEGFLINAENPAGIGTFDISVTLKADTTVDKSSINWSITDEENAPVAGISIEGNAKDPTKATITTTNEAESGYFLVWADYEDNGNSKNASLKLYFTERAFLYEYEYETKSIYEGQSDIYTWYNSMAGNVGAKFKEVNGRNTAYITLDDTAKSFGYIVRLLGEWGADSSTDREFGDRTLTAYEGERYTKVKGGEGIEIPYMLPSGKTYYDNGIVFAWRDDARFYNNTMDELANKTVSVVFEKQGSGSPQTKTMAYNAQDELFTYAYNEIEGITEGSYNFYFTVDGERVEDQYFNGVIEYRKPVLNIAATVTPEEADYDDNPVVSFKIEDTATGNDIEVSGIEADLTSLGYSGTRVNFNPLSKEGVLYIDRSVTPDTYRVPFTITDSWGNTTNTVVDITVAAKTDNDASWDESRIYFVLTDRFEDGDSSNNYNVNKDMIESYHGGDFKGLTSKLGYLQELGINTLWITPIVDNIDHVKNIELNQQAYHGYWAKDFAALDEYLGNMADLDKLLDEAHKRGIKVMVDIVVNHAGYDMEDEEQFAGMFRTEEDRVEGDVILDALDGLPDFKTEDPEVRAKLIAWQTAWVNHTTASGNRIDYFRVDTVKHVEHETWQDLKTSVAKVKPDFKMIGEYFGANISNTGDYLGNGQMDALLDFDFKDTAKKFVNGNIESVEAALESRNAKLSNSIVMGQFLSSHDEDGFLYSLGNDTAKMKTAAALQITAKGIPIIYYGEEINLTGPNAFGNQNNNRYDMQFTNLTPDQESMLTHYKKLLAARAMYSDVFAAGDRTEIAGSDKDGYLVFRRATDEAAVYTAINTKNVEKEATFDISIGNGGVGATSVVDLYSGQTIPVVGGQVTVTIPASSEGGTVILAEGKALTNVEFNAPIKTAYIRGEALELDGITVTAIYGDAKVPVSSDDYTVDTSAFKKDLEGIYTITVSYAGYDRSYPITVSKKAGESGGNSGGTSDGNTTPPAETEEKSKEESKKESAAPLELPTQKKEDGTVVTVVEAKGEYDFAATKVEGNLEISGNGVVIKNLTLDSDLIIKGKNVVIADSAIKSTVSIPGGSANTITLNGTTAPKLVIEKATLDSTKRVSLNISKDSWVDKLYVNAGAKVQLTESKGAQTAAAKYTVNNMYISVPEKAVVTLSGDYNKITLSSKNANIKLLKGKINKLTVKTAAANPNITLIKGTNITTLTTTPKAASETLTYKSSNKKVAAVSQKGKIKSVKKGKATVTVTNSNGKAVRCKVTVK